MIFRTIRVWLYRTRIRIWYVPYAYGTKYAYGIEQPLGLLIVPIIVSVVSSTHVFCAGGGKRE